ncbi:unnamed protein product [Phytophthora lilii]|uniref:Unnamed protein product n=1 Tax=Phytophthora lilii TaxID=2077276 RepID=A0A9W6U8F7_9STRA|nr:unnamed protein product [Phytophthora lilii]
MPAGLPATHVFNFTITWQEPGGTFRPHTTTTPTTECSATTSCRSTTCTEATCSDTTRCRRSEPRRTTAPTTATASRATTAASDATPSTSRAKACIAHSTAQPMTSCEASAPSTSTETASPPTRETRSTASRTGESASGGARRQELPPRRATVLAAGSGSHERPVPADHTGRLHGEDAVHLARIQPGRHHVHAVRDGGGSGLHEREDAVLRQGPALQLRDGARRRAAYDGAHPLPPDVSEQVEFFFLITSSRTLRIDFFVNSIAAHRAGCEGRVPCCVDTVLVSRCTLILLAGYVWESDELYYKVSTLKAFGISRLTEEDGSEFLVYSKLHWFSIPRHCLVVFGVVSGTSVDWCEERPCSGVVSEFGRILGGGAYDSSDSGNALSVFC